MNSLIKSLDEFSQNHTVNYDSNMERYANNINADYDRIFPKHYEARFKKYEDLDKCNEGFIKPRKHGKAKIKKKRVFISSSVETLKDLITLLNDYPDYPNVEYSINISGLHKIKEYLIKLDALIGLDELKENVLDQLIYFIHEKADDYLHTVLYGPPGTGKTEVAMILGKIYTNLGILERGTFIKVTRSDFVAGYLGQTAIKTRKLIEDNLGGVIFIDEAYALGNEEKRDSFSKEALDTLCELLSDHKRDLMVIIAGYKEELKKCFFSYNPGLESRFAWEFEIQSYSAKQLSQIFRKKVLDAKWFLDENVGSEEWFEEHIESFKNYGRDIENLFSKCKICHFRRIFGQKENQHILSMKDLEMGYARFTKHNSKNNKKDTAPNFMYT